VAAAPEPVAPVARPVAAPRAVVPKKATLKKASKKVKKG
jgi:hypothetical protein